MSTIDRYYGTFVVHKTNKTEICKITHNQKHQMGEIDIITKNILGVSQRFY